MSVEALVLSGGGAEGAYQVGVLRAMVEGRTPLPAMEDIKIFTGTSIGAFTAAFLVSHWKKGPSFAVDKLRDVWLNDLAGSLVNNGGYQIRGVPREIFNPLQMMANPLQPMMRMMQDSVYLSNDAGRRILELFNQDQSLAERILGLMNISTFVDVGPWEKVLQTSIDYKAINQEELVLRVVATNWEQGTPTIFDNRRFDRADPWRIVRASSAIPGLFPPALFEGAWYVDGGVLMNTPLKPAIRAKADVLHVINMNGPVDLVPLREPPNTMSTLYRQQLVEWGAKLNRDIERARTYNEAMHMLSNIEEQEFAGHVSFKAFMSAQAQANRQTEREMDYRPLTIHRYFPRTKSEVLDLVDLNTRNLENLMDRGYWDAVKHSCDHANCVFPIKD